MCADLHQYRPNVDGRGDLPVFDLPSKRLPVETMLMKGSGQERRVGGHDHDDGSLSFRTVMQNTPPSNQKWGSLAQGKADAHL